MYLLLLIKIITKLNILIILLINKNNKKKFVKYNKMPKIVDNYVLERKIGSGQFGEVYKGYNKITNVDIAVKVSFHFFFNIFIL